MKTQRWLITLLLALLVAINVLDALSTPVDTVAQDTAARYPMVGDCFDGEFFDFVWVQYIHAPRLIQYGCP